MQQSPELPISSIRSFRDSDELCAEVRRWNIDFRQLDCGEFLGKLKIAASPTLLLQRVRLNRRFHQLGSAPNGAMTFGVVNDEQLCGWSGSELRPGAVLNFNRSEGFESVSESGFEGYTFSVPDEVFRRRTNQMEPEFRLRSLRNQIHYVGNNHALAKRIRVLADLLVPRESEVLTGRQALELQDDIVCLLIEGISADTAAAETSNRTERSLAVSRAVEFVAATDATVLLSDVQEVSGVSRRTLNRGFQEQFGLSPKRFIVTRRLVDARRALLSAGTGSNVTTIAMDSGFTHLSRFAADYKIMFGEHPSDTLRRHRH